MVQHDYVTHSKLLQALAKTTSRTGERLSWEQTRRSDERGTGVRWGRGTLPRWIRLVSFRLTSLFYAFEFIANGR